eukprot:TRINITY_DN9168_c0_g1_i1.p3 TRINITY_DN9168_c0_g1~~TRINITY_DN9168_c0_g1_i1.p3  ORF type:complete len:142 (-),score=16.12 TRINITY_DN9168_c0_g1_i1:1-426(-)
MFARGLPTAQSIDGSRIAQTAAQPTTRKRPPYIAWPVDRRHAARQPAKRLAATREVHLVQWPPDDVCQGDAAKADAASAEAGHRGRGQAQRDQLEQLVGQFGQRLAADDAWLLPVGVGVDAVQLVDQLRLVLMKVARRRRL